MGLVANTLSTPTSTSLTDGGYDPRGLDAVRLATKTNDPSATKKVAQQFESMFLSMMLKNMRATLPGTDPLANDGSKMATDLYDQQLVQNLSKGKGMGLADALVAQIERAQGKPATGSTDATTSALDQFSNGVPLSMTRAKAVPLTRDGAKLAPVDAAGAATSPSSGKAGASSASSTSTGEVHHDFVDRFKQAAMAAAEATGLPARVILGQAALESGWGKHEVRDAKGAGSFNLFGIKAPAGWTGPTVDAVTTEIIDGVAQKVTQKFKAYASYAESFIDYAKTVANNPRYGKAVQAAGDALKFASEMGKSGYATDPDYGSKLARVLTGPLSKLL